MSKMQPDPAGNQRGSEYEKPHLNKMQFMAWGYKVEHRCILELKFLPENVDIHTRNNLIRQIAPAHLAKHPPQRII